MLTLFTLTVLAAVVVGNAWRENRNQKYMSTVTSTLTSIRDGLQKVGGELTKKIADLLATINSGELSPEQQTLADEINAKLAALDAVVPDAPPAEEPQAVS